MDITVNVLYFGLIREACSKTREEKVTIPQGSTVNDLITTLVDRYPTLAKHHRAVKIAINEAIAPTSTTLTEGDTIAFIPPVAGGGGRYCRLTEEPLSIDEVFAAVKSPKQGAVAIFVGIVRDHNEGHEVTHLFYEAYPEMVLRTLDSIIERCEATADGVRVAVAHRTGHLQIGDFAVVIAAAAPHRGEAFDACRMCIELLKQETPIWKKEFSSDGAEWIGMRP
ncbi:Molybdopterin synthase catalytic subunit 1 [Mycobacterium basiliense]|uniref:Molybdopterin synthase catalytic subunit 1 n=1 Tax=Mycobacterium basiliense TaxID=2094119 RepID=A0A3S4BLB7_9MYCO|nr:molybdopterin converting factor subunit 1 [Mycobacterium basiliense]VDM90737.1 Molybdopterin synthase catalytic subunit 1 [Mycobacterium basiliense]